jgi:taurine dioxygenase
LEIRPITPSVGAAVRDLDARNVSNTDADSLKECLCERKVLVLRDQSLTSREYVKFVGLFGEPVADDLVPHDGHPPELAILHIQPKERQTINFWHMDYSFRDKPAPVLSLYSRHLPPCGGDTLFTNLEAAYAGLSDEMKGRIQGLETNHKVTPTQNAAKRFSPEEFDAMVNGEPVRHPLVCRHPQTGRQYLFVNVPIYCRSIVGMENEEGDALLSSLYRHVQRPEFHFRLTWETDTVVVWENTHCLHYPVSDYFPNERILWRVATQGKLRPAA